MAAYRIPSEVIVDILVCLPVKSLLRFKSVCKDWYTLIISSFFIQLHLNKSLEFKLRHNCTLFYTNDDYLCVVDDIYCPSNPIKIYWPKEIIRARGYFRTVGSCNGLVCLCVTNGLYFDAKVLCFLVCNPSTHTFKFKPTLPFSELKRLDIYDSLSYGFGYDGKHDDYKIVVTGKYLNKNVRDDDVYIYSFKADSWKCVTHTPAEGSTQFYCLKQDNVVCANNMLHYIVYSLVDEDENNRIYRIDRFDLSSETWRDDLSFPAGVKDWTYTDFGVLDDLLYLRLGKDYRPHNVWVMKGYGDDSVEDSWCMMYNILDYFHNYTLFAASKEGPLRLLIVRKYSNYSGVHHLLWYNPYDHTTESFELGKSSSDSLFHLCIASLVTIPGSSFDYKATRKRLR